MQHNLSAVVGGMLCKSDKPSIIIIMTDAADDDLYVLYIHVHAKAYLVTSHLAAWLES